MKRAFVPKLDALMFFDYQQIEPRLMAYYLHEIGYPRLAESLNKGVDPYTAIGRGYFHKDELEEWERQLGKQTFLSLTYGGGLPAIRRYFAELSWGEAQKVRDNFWKAWPEMKILQAMLDDVCETKGYITTLLGRHLHPDSPHKRINTLMQGSASDLIRNALVTVDENLKGSISHIINAVHDDIQIDALEHEVPVLAEKVPQWMDYQKVSEIVPVSVSCEISRTTWAEKEEYVRQAQG